MSQVRAGTIALFVLSLPVLVGIFVYGPFVLDLFVHRRPPSRFLIPAGYVGWVRVEYRVAGAPPLGREGKYLVVRVANYSGTTRQPLSNAGWCKGGMIWDETSGKDDKAPRFLKFFVGSEDQFRVEVDPAGRTYSPCG